MEAANRGAREVGGQSSGGNISLPHERRANPWVDRYVELDHFLLRKMMMIKLPNAWGLLPDGWGTLDEIFETMTLKQTGKIDPLPVIMLGGIGGTP